MDKICATKYSSGHEVHHSKLLQCDKIIGITFAYRNSLEHYVGEVLYQVKFCTRFVLITGYEAVQDKDDKATHQYLYLI